jgi:hypothetical protein
MACLSNSKVDPELLRRELKDKTPEQKKVIRYFLTSGCLARNISDDAYEKMVFSKRDQIDFKARALSKIGLDEDQINEIPPVKLEGYSYKLVWGKRKAGGDFVSSAYVVSWIFFSSTQIYLYMYKFNMDSDELVERTEEFFYKDVTSFSTISEVETTRAFSDKVSDKPMNIQTHLFQMIVPGDKLTVPIPTNFSETVIQAMKQKLREKKM